MGAMKEIESWHAMNKCEDEADWADLRAAVTNLAECGAFSCTRVSNGYRVMGPGTAWLHLKDDAARQAFIAYSEGRHIPDDAQIILVRAALRRGLG